MRKFSHWLRDFSDCVVRDRKEIQVGMFQDLFTIKLSWFWFALLSGAFSNCWGCLLWYGHDDLWRWHVIHGMTFPWQCCIWFRKVSIWGIFMEEGEPFWGHLHEIKDCHGIWAWGAHASSSGGNGPVHRQKIPGIMLRHACYVKKFQIPDFSFALALNQSSW